jgi:hypothetical protein
MREVTEVVEDLNVQVGNLWSGLTPFHCHTNDC